MVSIIHYCPSLWTLWTRGKIISNFLDDSGLGSTLFIIALFMDDFQLLLSIATIMCFLIKSSSNSFTLGWRFSVANSLHGEGVGGKPYTCSIQTLCNAQGVPCISIVQPNLSPSWAHLHGYLRKDANSNFLFSQMMVSLACPPALSFLTQ